MTILTISRDWGVDPSIVRITDDANLATITTTGYVFTQAPEIEAIQNGAFEWVSTDEILIAYSNGEGFFTYDSTTGSFIAAPTAPGSLSNTLASGDIFVGSAGNIATGVVLSGDATITNAGVMTIANNAITTAKILAANVTSPKLDPQVIQYVEVDMTAAQWNGMYAAPVQLVAAPGANHLIVVDKIDLNMTFVAASYAAGGVVAAQYDSTVHGAGSPASATIAAATINGYAASTAIMVDGVISSVLFTACVNKGLFLSNQTGAFTTGDGTWKIQVWYRIVATV